MWDPFRNQNMHLRCIIPLAEQLKIRKYLMRSKQIFKYTEQSRINVKITFKQVFNIALLLFCDLGISIPELPFNAFFISV